MGLLSIPTELKYKQSHLRENPCEQILFSVRPLNILLVLYGTGLGLGFFVLFLYYFFFESGSYAVLSWTEL